MRPALHGKVRAQGGVCIMRDVLSVLSCALLSPAASMHAPARRHARYGQALEVQSGCTTAGFFALSPCKGVQSLLQPPSAPKHRGPSPPFMRTSRCKTGRRAHEQGAAAPLPFDPFLTIRSLSPLLLLLLLLRLRLACSRPASPPAPAAKRASPSRSESSTASAEG